MYTKEQLRQLTAAPKISEISLQLLQEFYDEYICSNRFFYEFKGGLVIELDFYPEGLAHLLGIHHVHDRFKGISAYDEIKTGRLTFDVLRSTNKTKFKSIKHRLTHFPFISQLLENPSVIKFDGTIIKDCKIKCEFILYDNHNNSIVHLGIESTGAQAIFYSKTFIIELNNGDKFIKDQQQMVLEKIRIEPKNPPAQTSQTTA
ncbi:PBECR4 domain-containing protein [Paradesulfitobacterium ferrireducens]|uniref:PBECR4 domain-containing protein n=1 Tax=Paradesulfitobacterium ferrireducens TaxID=2816476 RepID=UPI001A8EC280|nr:PBECR4 domain-containing protein [Paradesulfitobacterium ferrireducens]